MNYLLDTNTFIDFLRRGSASRVTARLASLSSGSVYSCSVVLAELLYGAWHSGAMNQAKNLALVGSLRARFPSLPFDDAAAEVYGSLRADLAARGMLIGPNDLMIASIAMAHQLTLVTHNTAEFSRVPSLALETWH